MSFSRFLGAACVVAALAAPANAQQAPAEQFQGLYSELQTAIAARDTARIDQLIAPEFTVTDFRGQTRTRAQMIERLGQMPGGDGAASPATKVLSASVIGQAAVVTQQLTIETQRKLGSEVHTMQIVLTARDAWANRAGQWLLVKSEQQELVVNRDGEEFMRETR